MDDTGAIAPAPDRYMTLGARHDSALHRSINLELGKLEKFFSLTVRCRMMRCICSKITCNQSGIFHSLMLHILVRENARFQWCSCGCGCFDLLGTFGWWRKPRLRGITSQQSEISSERTRRQTPSNYGVMILFRKKTTSIWPSG